MNKYTFYTLILFSINIMLCQSLPKMLSNEFCHKQDDCPINYCCVLGFERYSIPHCQPMGKFDDWCRLYNEPQQRSLAYPNGQHIDTEVYIQFCGCSDGLVCQRAKCTFNSSLQFDNNFID
ncbi:astakine-like, partial [Oppia nitens]|uniref:astakine-like n=1 Tax=Oppia nitens TaxID=1686743 RepID=UPI0023DCE9EF